MIALSPACARLGPSAFLLPPPQIATLKAATAGGDKSNYSALALAIKEQSSRKKPAAQEKKGFFSNSILGQALSGAEAVRERLPPASLPAPWRQADQG